MNTDRLRTLHGLYGGMTGTDFLDYGFHGLTRTGTDLQVDQSDQSVGLIGDIGISPEGV